MTTKVAAAGDGARAPPASHPPRYTRKEHASLDWSFKTLRALPDLSGISHLTRHVRALNLSGNALLKLSGLEHLPALESLNVSGNRLVRLDVAQNVNLTHLDASRNSLMAIAGLGGCIRLAHLSLANNCISKVEGLDAQRSLETLDLSHNACEALGDISLCARLTHVNLSHNAVATLYGASALLPSALRVLNLECNELVDVAEMKHLAPCANLVSLTLRGNPLFAFAASCGFEPRAVVAFALPRLAALDGEGTSTATWAAARCERRSSATTPANRVPTCCDCWGRAIPRGCTGISPPPRPRRRSPRDFGDRPSRGKAASRPPGRGSGRRAAPCTPRRVSCRWTCGRRGRRRRGAPRPRRGARATPRTRASRTARASPTRAWTRERSTRGASRESGAGPARVPVLRRRKRESAFRAGKPRSPSSPTRPPTRTCARARPNPRRARCVSASGARRPCARRPSASSPRFVTRRAGNRRRASPPRRRSRGTASPRAESYVFSAASASPEGRDHLSAPDLRVLALAAEQAEASPAAGTTDASPRDESAPRSAQGERLAAARARARRRARPSPRPRGVLRVRRVAVAVAHPGDARGARRHPRGGGYGARPSREPAGGAACVADADFHVHADPPVPAETEPRSTSPCRTSPCPGAWSSRFRARRFRARRFRARPRTAGTRRRRRSPTRAPTRRARSGPRSSAACRARRASCATPPRSARGTSSWGSSRRTRRWTTTTRPTPRSLAREAPIDPRAEAGRPRGVPLGPLGRHGRVFARDASRRGAVVALGGDGAPRGEARGARGAKLTGLGERLVRRGECEPSGEGFRRVGAVRLGPKRFARHPPRGRRVAHVAGREGRARRVRARGRPRAVRGRRGR